MLHLRKKRHQHPHNTHQPPQRIITPHTPPIQNKRRRDALPENQRREKDENGRDQVICNLEEENAADDLERREVC